MAVPERSKTTMSAAMKKAAPRKAGTVANVEVGCARCYARCVAGVDVVVVSYNSRDELRECVEPLAALGDVNVIVVDNASSDGSLEAVADLRVKPIALDRNGGFGHGCNVGWRAGGSPYVLFLNPDARTDASSLNRLVDVLELTPDAGAAAPRIAHTDGTLDYSLRRYPRLRSTYARALFLHRVFPRASWTDEVIRDPTVYEGRRSPDWVSGACILVRRSVLEQLDGFDEGFFMYCEDIDLCRRIHDGGHDLVYEPAAVVTHVGGASAPRASLLPVLAASRLRYAGKHWSAPAALLERLGVALEALTRVVVSRGGRAARAGHGRAFILALTRPAT
jgi:N-acetylglucosaminyl-diphospho-decaprenol L-rhamnosyltransferase